MTKNQIVIDAAGGDTATPLNLKKRIQQIANCIQINGSSILDCGCGRGEYVLALNSLGAKARGIEFLEQKVQEAHLSGLNDDLVMIGDAQDLPFPDSSFDALIFNEVLEHVPDDSMAIREAFRVLKPEGHLLIFSPNRFYPFETHGVYRKNTKKLLPVWTPFIPYIPVRMGQLFFDYWARNYWPKELRNLVKSAGFSISSSSYLWQTFEGIANEGSGTTNWMKPLRPILRMVSRVFEQCYFIRSFGVSQFVHGKKSGTNEK